MSFFFDRVRGMQDVLPPLSFLYKNLENIMYKCASSYDFSFVRTPVLEFTELFDRSVGDSSDIVQKEMYTFNDKSGRSVTMRPEFTAGIIRAIASANSSTFVLPLKLMYYGPCYRYEKPQVGRLREFYQFGVEIIGGNSFLADLDIISLAHKIFTTIGIRNFRLEINCVGCQQCRYMYLDSIKTFFERNIKFLCDICKKRLKINPLRILDCKNECCKKICFDAPHTLDFLCESCLENFEKLKKNLTICDIPYVVNTRIVRGLDYYNKLVFEFVVNINNSDLTICGGGRYDGLSALLGGPDLSSSGFAIGVERIVKLVQDQQINLTSNNQHDIYIAYLDDESQKLAVKLVSKFRKFGFCADYDLVGKGLKSQLRYANKIGYRFVTVLGSEEVSSGIITIKRMHDGTTRKFEVRNDNENLFEYIKNS